MFAIHRIILVIKNVTPIVQHKFEGRSSLKISIQDTLQ